MENQIASLQQMRYLGTDTDCDTAISALNKIQFNLKESLVKAVHKNKITKTSVENHGKRKPAWQTRVRTRTGEKKRPRRFTYEELIEILFEIYYGKVLEIDYSFQGVFESAIKEKIAKENPKSKTIKDYRDTYKAFISDELGATDIRTITPEDLMIYIQEVTQRMEPTEKRFLKLKGLFNLVFEFSTEPKQNYIALNPVPKNNRPFLKNCKPSPNKPEDKAFQLAEVDLIQKMLWQRVNSLKYDVNGFAILFASETGCRQGEIPALKWSDVSENKIHIHAQQNDHTVDGKKCYYYFPCTKEERGRSKGGRYIPMTDTLRNILTLLYLKQASLGIVSEWVFCKANGDWITTAGYNSALYRLCKKLGLQLTHNHAFRASLNSYVLEEIGIPTTTRAAILGHTPETNMRCYTFPKIDYVSEAATQMNAFKLLMSTGDMAVKDNTNNFFP